MALRFGDLYRRRRLPDEKGIETEDWVNLDGLMCHRGGAASPMRRGLKQNLIRDVFPAVVPTGRRRLPDEKGIETQLPHH